MVTPKLPMVTELVARQVVLTSFIDQLKMIFPPDTWFLYVSDFSDPTFIRQLPLHFDNADGLIVHSKIHPVSPRRHLCADWVSLTDKRQPQATVLFASDALVSMYAAIIMRE